MTHSITRLIPAALAMMASPLLADTTVIQAERVIVAPDAPPLGRSTITVTDGRIVSPLWPRRCISQPLSASGTLPGRFGHRLPLNAQAVMTRSEKVLR